jgi:hypothetical protein
MPQQMVQNDAGRPRIAKSGLSKRYGSRGSGYDHIRAPQYGVLFLGKPPTMARLPKPYLLTFEERPGYLFANLKAESVTEEIIRAYVVDLVAKAQEAGLTRILLYRDIPAIMSVTSMFETVRESLDALRGKKLALVNPHLSIESDLQFGVTVGQNRGGNYSVFDNVPDAEAWLLS